MDESEIKALFKSPAGYLGPVGIEWARDRKKDADKAVLFVDKALEGRVNGEGFSSDGVCGFARGDGG